MAQIEPRDETRHAVGLKAPSGVRGQSRGHHQPVAVWLFVVAALIALMVLVGGATRLTDSGLSITEWKPVTGAIPPLSEAHWLQEFEKYKAIPEYEEVNWGMSLEAFKVIYWWEWGHRFLGRLIGLAFAVPFAFFLITRRIGRGLALKLTGLLILGGAQGAIGWWMVSSGLSERVDVSQYRLAAHLGMAIALFGATLWIALDLVTPGARRIGPAPVEGMGQDMGKAMDEGGRDGRFYPAALALAGLIYGQIILGAFVAGLRAGRTYTTWPLMDGRFIPAGYFGDRPMLRDLFERIAAVQFNHRMGAYLVVLCVLLFAFVTRSGAIARRTQIVAALALGQTVLGIATVLNGAPLSLGLAHQAGALALFAAALYAAHGCGMGISSSNGRSSVSTTTERALTV